MDIIYGDIYFLINFSMDFISLFICSRVRRLPPGIARSVLSSVIGSAFALSLLFVGQTTGGQGILLSCISALMPLLMCYISFGFGRLSSYLITCATFYVTSLTLGGVMTALYYFAGKLTGANKLYINGRQETVYSDIPLWLFMAAAAAAALGAMLWNRLAAGRAGLCDCRLEIKNGKRTINKTALCDSGNLLTEPIGGLPVILLSPELMKALTGGHGVPGRRLRIIPYGTISGTGIMYGFIPDSVKVNGVTRRACICSGGELDAGFNGYEAIVPALLAK